MVFSEYMLSLPSPRAEIVNKIALRCKVSRSSVYRWIKGKAKPNALCRSLVSDVLNQSEAELFPMS